MSTPHTDESGINRMWLGGLLVPIAIFAAASVGFLEAAPRSPHHEHEGPEGVVVLEDAAGTVLEGTVIVRGTTIAVVSPDGSQEMLPRRSVRWIETGRSTLSDAYWEKFPEGQFKTAARRGGETAAAPAPAARKGPVAREMCLVLHTGEVLTGRTVQTAEGYELKRSDGLLARVPAPAVRWAGVGSQPGAEYWVKFSGEPIDPRYAHPTGRAPGEGRSSTAIYTEQGRKNPKVTQALLAQNSGDFAGAAQIWFEVYAQGGYQALHLENLDHCVRSAVRAHVEPRLDVKRLKEGVDALVARAGQVGAAENKEVRHMLVDVVGWSATVAYDAGYPNSARQLTRSLATLGGEYPRLGDAIWQQLGARPQPRMIREAPDEGGR